MTTGSDRAAEPLTHAEFDDLHRCHMTEAEYAEYLRKHGWYLETFGPTGRPESLHDRVERWAREGLEEHEEAPSVPQALGQLATLAQLQKQRLPRSMGAGEYHAIRGSAERLRKAADQILEQIERKVV